MGGVLGLIFGAGLVLVIIGTPQAQFQRKAGRAILIPWPQFIDDVASGVRAGVSLPLAIFDAGERLPAPTPRVFAQWRQNWTAGFGFEQSLSGLREDLGSATFELFADTVEIAHRQGGRSVATLLSQLAHNVRAQEQLVHEVRGRQAVTVTSAKVAVAAPWVVLVLTGVRPEVRDTYLTAQGFMVLFIVAVISSLSYVAMRRVAQITELGAMR